MPKKVDEYFDSVKESNPEYSDARAWATAWSIYCRYKNPGSPSCRKDSPEDYFIDRKAGSPLRNRRDYGDAPIEEILLRYVKKSSS
jgi:hypothetical protein